MFDTTGNSTPRLTRVTALRDQIEREELTSARWLHGKDQVELDAFLLLLASESKLARFVMIAYEPDAKSYSVVQFVRISSMEAALEGFVDRPRALVVAMDLDTNRRYSMIAKVHLAEGSLCG